MKGGEKKAMKAISIKLDVPEWIDEEKFGALLKRIAEKIVYPEKLSAEEVREIFGTFEEEIGPVDVREEEKERINWLYSILR